MSKLHFRKAHEHFISTNLHRLSDETLAKIWNQIEDEVEQAVIKEEENEQQQ